MSALDVISGVLVIAGSAFALTASIGVVRFPDTLSRMQAATKPQVLGLLLVLAGAAVRLRGNVDLGMILLAAIFTLITAPVIANRVGRLAYYERGVRVDLLTEDQLAEDTERGLPERPLDTERGLPERPLDTERGLPERPSREVTHGEES